MLVGRSVFLKSEMIHHGIAADKEYPPFRRTLSMHDNIECLSPRGALHTAPVEISLNPSVTHIVLHERATYVALKISKRVTPQKSG